MQELSPLRHECAKRIRGNPERLEELRSSGLRQAPSSLWDERTAGGGSTYMVRGKLRPLMDQSLSQALGCFCFCLVSILRGAFYSWEVITPTTGASPGLTRVAYLRPHQMSLSTLAWGGCRGREFPRTGAANILAIQSRVKQILFLEGEVIGHTRAVEKVSQRFIGLGAESTIPAPRLLLARHVLGFHV